MEAAATALQPEGRTQGSSARPRPSPTLPDKPCHRPTGAVPYARISRRRGSGTHPRPAPDVAPVAGPDMPGYTWESRGSLTAYMQLLGGWGLDAACRGAASRALSRISIIGHNGSIIAYY